MDLYHQSTVHLQDVVLNNLDHAIVQEVNGWIPIGVAQD
jgi:hypothetical protein